MSDTFKEEINATKVRIESLKGNRNFFTVLFTVESALLAIIFKYFCSFRWEFAVSVAFLFIGIIIILFSVFLLTDSIHFYSKNLEYQNMWKAEVHGVAFEGETKEKKATESLKRALESDRLGYYFLKLSLISFIYFLVSLVLNVYGLRLTIRIHGFIMLIVFVTFAAVYCYKVSHMKNWRNAFADYFIPKRVFPKDKDNKKE